MRFSKEQNKKHLELVRRYVVRMPEATVVQLAEMCDLSHDYVAKLKRKIEGDRATRINYQTVNKELAKIEDIYKELDKECWKVIQDNSVAPSTKIKAIDTFASNLKRLIDVKFDAGVFKKDLGEVDVRQISVNIIKNADKSDNSIPEKL